MFQHPEFALAQAHDRRRELTARAERYRLSAILRRRSPSPPSRSSTACSATSWATA